MTALSDPAPEQARAGSDRARARSAFWAAFAAPGTVWLMALFLVPAYAILAVAFGGVDPILRTAQPAWNPAEWEFGAMRHALDRVFTGDLAHVFVRTGLYALLALIGCFAIGYPVAYYVARVAGRTRGVLLVLLVLPFWISYLMRMLAWVNLLQPDGLTLKCRFVSGAGTEALLNATLAIGQGLAGWAARNRRTLLNADPRLTFEALGIETDHGLQSAMVTPLTVNDTFIGCLTLFHTQPNRYTEDHRRLLEACRGHSCG